MAGDIFAGLVPDSSAKVVSKYTEMVDDLIKKEKTKLQACANEHESRLREAELPQLLASLDPKVGLHSFPNSSAPPPTEPSRSLDESTDPPLLLLPTTDLVARRTPST